MQAFEHYDNVEDLGLQCSPIILKVRPKISYKFWISFSTTTPIAQAFEQNDSVEEFLL